MTIFAVTVPPYPIVTSDGHIDFQASSNTGGVNFVRLWCTDAPAGSTLRKQLDKEGASRVELPAIELAANGAAAAVQRMPFDRGGKYVLQGQEYTRGTTYGGGYAGAPDAKNTETKVGSEQSLGVYVGQRFVHRLGSSSHGTAQLLVYAWNETIRPTSMAVHGVLSPAIINPSNIRAANAANASAVLTKLALFENATVASLTTNLDTLINELVTDIPKHFNNLPAGAYHTSPDTDNDTEIEKLTKRLKSPGALMRIAQVMANRLRLHMQNGSDGSKGYHAEPDFEDALIADFGGSEADQAAGFAALADVVRCYIAHIAQGATYHAGGADSNNTIGTTIDPLIGLHKEFLAALAGIAPTANGPVMTAAARLDAMGFRLEQ